MSPTISTSACGIVPVGSASISSADFVTATPSQPPMKALRSIIGASEGCMRRAPKEITWRWPAAILQRAALVAMPEAWQSSPSRAVSYCAQSTYTPSSVRTGW